MTNGALCTSGGERVNTVSLIFCHIHQQVSTNISEAEGDMANLLTLCDFVCVANGWTNNGTYGWHGHAIFSLHTKDEVSYEQCDLKVSALFKK